MNGQEFKAWREGFGLTQAEVADKFDVTRTTIQTWEIQAGALPKAVENGCQVWGRRLRQEDPLRGPVTLIYSSGPLHIDPYGPRRPPAMMKQEAHPSNAAALARARILAGSSNVWNPFVVEDGARDLWNVIELQRAIDGGDSSAPTLPNLLRRVADGIRADAPNFVRSGPRLATPDEVAMHVQGFETFAEELERIAGRSVMEIVAEHRTIEAVMAGVRQLGVRPKDTLVTAIAQAVVAAAMLTDDTNPIVPTAGGYMRFHLGQKFYGRGGNGHIALVVQIFDDGHEAWVEMRDQSGAVQSSARVNMAQMRQNWTMSEPGFQKQVRTTMNPF